MADKANRTAGQRFMPSGKIPAANAASKDVPEQKQKTPPGPEPIIAFYIFFAAHVLGAIFSPIQDCDEVYNYWEPTHYLNHGYGMQTWEYSPDYAIRSWAYVGIHAVIIKLGHILPFVNSKHSEFYFLRIIFAFVCAVCETRLYSVVTRLLNPRIAIIYLIVSVTSPGMFHASVSYLPSTFAMYGVILGLTAFMDWSGGLRTAQGIMWFGIGAVLGWPFAGVLVLPFIFEEILLASMTRQGIESIWRLLDGTVRSLIALALQTFLDIFFYRKPLCVPWNIVVYNIFSGSNKGPDIYGTEPWDFYIRNLLINFNVWFVLAFCAMPLLLLQHFVRGQTVSRQSILRSIVFVSPFYLWLAIFTLQPHKEERFMYPAYPALALNAAFSLHILLSHIGSTNPKDLVSKIPGQVKFAFVMVFAIAAIDVGLLRSLGLATAYSAPLSVYAPLREPGVARPGDTVCLAKEWYRFPSSYHLPNGMKAKFVKSAFTGLLPGEFSEARVGFGFFPGAWLIPPGMNDENIEDPGKYTDIEHCQYMVDSYFPGTTPSELEPNYILDTDTWERLECKTFLDTTRTSLLGRLFWVPDWPLIPERYRRKWGEYCLLRRTNKI